MKLHSQSRSLLFGRVSLLALLAGASAALGCSSPMMATTKYATKDPNPEAWRPLEPGQRLVVHAPPGSCAVAFADSLKKLASGEGQQLAGHASAAHPKIVRILDSRVQTGSSGWVGLEVADEAGQKTWLRLEAGADPGCVMPVPEGFDAIKQLAGKQLAFTPWKAACTELQAAGQSPGALLLETEPGAPVQVSGFEFGPREASKLGSVGNATWVQLANGVLKVRADSVLSCFSPFGSPEAAPPADPTAFLHVLPGACLTAEDGGKRHVECRSSLGVWEGMVSPTAIELRLARRTLGPVHFLGVRPVDGSRYARAVVAVTQGQASDGRATALYGAMNQAVAQALAKESGGAVRLSAAGAPDVTYSVHVDVSNIQIGDLLRREVQETTQYKAGEETRDNPKHPVAEQRVETARERLSQAEQEHQEAVERWETLKQEALERCNQAAQSAKDDTARMFAKAGCDAAGIAGQFVRPSSDGVDSARAELDSAQSEFASTPRTIQVPIMKDHEYTKVLYSRSVAAQLQIAMRAQDAAAPEVVGIPLSHGWSDYEVQADPAHNVKGHTPEQAPLRDAEALVPFIARQASAALASRLTVAISNATIAEAKKAFVAAGNESKPGYEAVDALAFDVAGKRLGQVVLRGNAELAQNRAFALPAKVLSLTPGECLLAVAASNTASGFDVFLRTPSGSHADHRGKSMAMVEVCGSELPKGQTSVDAIELSSKSGGQARWALYRTRATQDAVVTQGPPVAQQIPGVVR